MWSSSTTTCSTCERTCTPSVKYATATSTRHRRPRERQFRCRHSRARAHCWKSKRSRCCRCNKLCVPCSHCEAICHQGAFHVSDVQVCQPCCRRRFGNLRG